MAERDQKNSTDRQTQGNDDQANYNPTDRNFDQLDVSGSPEPISGDSGDQRESTDRNEESQQNNSKASWDEKRRYAKNR